MGKTQAELIAEEQAVLDELIKDMDQALLELDSTLTYEMVQASKKRAVCLPDAYADLLDAEQAVRHSERSRKNLKLARDHLYEQRLHVEFEDEIGRDEEDIMIGLHQYMSESSKGNGPRIFISSWTLPVCRHYLMDNAETEYWSDVEDRYGNHHETHYSLKLKRAVTLSFDKVKSVSHMYPVLEDVEQVIADEFLAELYSRRSEQEFKNIVFTIQKRQGEIIQTPFRHNLIVQGCAGSGKSMIMLHRLPIILIDNPNELLRSRLYIITPSITYMQMAANMCMDLEITDLEMGTLTQYYDRLIARYPKMSSGYGRLRPDELTKDQIDYVYSQACIDDIQDMLWDKIEEEYVDCSVGYSTLGAKGRPKIVGTPSDQIRNELISIKDLLNRNNQVLEKYHRAISGFISALNKLAEKLDNRKQSILRKLNQIVTEKLSTIASADKELEKTDELKSEFKYRSLLKTIEDAKMTVDLISAKRTEIESDNACFDDISCIAGIVRQKLAFFAAPTDEKGNKKQTDVYWEISLIQELLQGFAEITEYFAIVEDPYSEYAESLSKMLEAAEQAADVLKNVGGAYLPAEYHRQLEKADGYFSALEKNIVKEVYLAIMEKAGIKGSERGRIIAVSCSPYLYLQVLYNYMGAPRGVKDSLITIDEAQNMASEELRLIKAVNGSKLIFNLFGDVRQHIEGSKGIDSWDELTDIADFKTEEMQENYRNARQITEYCNKRFSMEMRAINLDGAGVHEYQTCDDFEENFLGMFQRPQNDGFSCILVKDGIEAQNVMAIAGEYRSRIHYVTETDSELHANEWNLMTVGQARGLEFSTVFAISGSMGENEKYIAYTRALYELYVYDKELPLPEKKTEDMEDMITADEEKPDGTESEEHKHRRKEKRQRRSEPEHLDDIPDVKGFFESNGLTVIDDRDESGLLWVLGEKKSIEPIVEQAMDIYGIMGSYGRRTVSGEGWFTKTRK